MVQPETQARYRVFIGLRFPRARVLVAKLRSASSLIWSFVEIGTQRGPLFDLGYSKRNAAIGSRRAAFCAG